MYNCVVVVSDLKWLFSTES